MPIAFPGKQRGHTDIWAKGLVTRPPGFVSAANLGNPGVRFMADTLGPGRGKIVPRAEGNPGMNFALAYAQHGAEPRPQFLLDARLARENDGTLNMVLTGVSRDSAGVALGNCQVLAFRTSNKEFVGETTSDASGNWSMTLMTQGPFFLVEYKAGAPDVAGTSLNTLTPVAV